MAVVSAVVIALAAWQFIDAAASTERLEPETLCPAEGGPRTFWAVLIDGTEAYSAVQWADIMSHVTQIKTEVPQHGMLAVFTVPENPSEALVPEVALCNPGSGEKLSVWTGNPELARKRWEDEFVAPLDSIFEALNTSETLQRSPIMETIQVASGVVSNRYMHSSSPMGRSIEYEGIAGPSRLFIVSDMMQHTERYSHYSGGSLDFDALRSTPFYPRLQIDLSDWYVTVFYARRDDAASRQVQGRQHLDFWNNYFYEVANLRSGSALRIIQIKG